MTFYEKELRKIVEPNCPDATYVGRACYVRLNEMNRAKIQFITGGIASHYEALRVTILNKQRVMWMISSCASRTSSAKRW